MHHILKNYTEDTLKTTDSFLAEIGIQPVPGKSHFERFVQQNIARLKDKTVLDLPAGTGCASRLMNKVGANVKPYDLFPQFFESDTMVCQFADISKSIPEEDAVADFVVCQEGIEHFSDQNHVFEEFNRVLKIGGSLLITTPNYSNLKSKLSYLLTESEYFIKDMPPNEVDSVWFSDQQGQMAAGFYFGHVFSVGINKMRLFGILNGFKIKSIYPVRVNKTSALLMPLLYPLIVLINKISLNRAERKISKKDATTRQQIMLIYQEICSFNTNINVLTDFNLFIEWEKISDLDQARKKFQESGYR